MYLVCSVFELGFAHVCDATFRTALILMSVDFPFSPPLLINLKSVVMLVQCTFASCNGVVSQPPSMYNSVGNHFRSVTVSWDIFSYVWLLVG